MSSTSSTLPSPAELENLGVLFIGFVAATILYGLTFFQTYIYYSRYPRDLQWMKYLVATLCSLDTAASAIVSQVLYYYLIVMFDVNMDILYATTTFCVQYMLSVILTFISQLFFAYRVFQVTGGSKLTTSVVIFLSFISLIFGLTSSGQMFAQRRLSAFGSSEMEIVAALSQFIAAAADAIVFAVMCYSLRRSRYPEMAVPVGFVETAVTLLVGRGLAFTIIHVAYFCVFVAAPERQFWIPLQMVTSKLYVNTVLGLLNSREVKLGQGLNEEDSLTDRKASTSVGLPSAIRFNVTDAKGTTQSINFNTRPDDIESEGTELEARKTYQDEHGNEYAQVSSRSTQSQTDNEQDKASLSSVLH